MAKNNGRVPPKSMPYPVQVRLLREQNAALKASLNKLRRVTWLAVHASKNRIEISRADYIMASQKHDNDCVIALQRADDNSGGFVLVKTDMDGKILPESEAQRIVITG